jgi:hypothetical protein
MVTAHVPIVRAGRGATPRGWIARHVASAVVGALLVGGTLPRAQSRDSGQLAGLADAEFWKLIETFSERGGSFHSDNFTSNEPGIANGVADLAASGLRGGAYLGVGPEQNFSYIAALEPAIAFILDIRRQAVMQHLLFKALFELSSDRAEFIASLFSVPKPTDGSRTDAVDTIWSRFAATPGADRSRFEANLARVVSHLRDTHVFPLSSSDVTSLTYVYEAFFKLGPEITYAGFVTKGLTTGNTNFMKLTQATDAAGEPRGFLSTDEAFQFVKSLQTRNLVVPVEADFGGPTALRAIGAFLRARDLRVTAFYISNVEQYLFNPRSPTAPGGQETNGGWRAFYSNLATLPADRSTVLLRVPRTGLRPPIRRVLPDGTIGIAPSVALCPMQEFLTAVAQGRVTSQTHATACGR